MASASTSSGKARTSTKGVVVWEWFNEFGKWRPYSPDVVAYIDKEVQNSTQQVHLGKISPCLKMYTIDIPSMCQIRTGTGTSRPVRRVIYPDHSPPAQQVRWEFEGDYPGHWVSYDMEISQCLEQAHQSGQQMLDMMALFQMPYSIHFTTMQQVRMNTGRARQIRRSPLQTPYPPATKASKVLNRLTTIPADLSISTSASSSTSQHSVPSANSSMSVASGSGMHRVLKRTLPSSSSDSSSEADDSSSGMTLRTRTRLTKKLKKHPGRVKKSKSSTVTSSMGSTSGNGMPAQPVAYTMPTVSLVGTGPTMSLSLAAYAQPLGANLSQGFPPMAHIPMSSHHHPQHQASASSSSSSHFPHHHQQHAHHFQHHPSYLHGATPPPSSCGGGGGQSSLSGQGLSSSQAATQSSHSHSGATAVYLNNPSSTAYLNNPSTTAYLNNPASSVLQMQPGGQVSSAASLVSSSSQMLSHGTPVPAHHSASAIAAVKAGHGHQNHLHHHHNHHLHHNHHHLHPAPTSNSWAGLAVGGAGPLSASSVSSSMPSSGGAAPSSAGTVLSSSAASTTMALMGHTLNALSVSPAGVTAHPSSSSSSLAQSAHQVATYQGPLTRTRNRLHKQQGVVPGGGGADGGAGGGASAGMGGQMVSCGLNGVHHHLLSPLAQSYGAATTPGSQPSHLHPHHLPHPHAHQQGQLNPGSRSGPSQQPPAQHQSYLNLRLRQMQHQHQQQQQKQQQQHMQQVAGMGSSAGYPFNLSSFVPTMGINILPQSSLLLPGSGGSQQHIQSCPTGGSSRGQQPAANLPVTESLPDEKKIVLTKLKKTKQKPKSGEEVLNKYMEPVAPQENEDCSICCDALTGPSSYGEGKPQQFDVIQLNKCSHMFHRLCLLAMYDSSHKGDSLQCPTCKTIYGELMGNCPPGDMEFDIIPSSLPGYPHCPTLRVTYYISPGVQGQEHPHPGQRFTARGFPRSGFLPDDNRGRKILKMMMLAFKRRLMFTIGQSATTGESDTVIWNDIHHKTEFGSNVSGHGYPDPNYLDNVTAELALKGITEQDLL